jgi:hypothetical protein
MKHNGNFGLSRLIKTAATVLFVTGTFDAVQAQTATPAPVPAQAQSDATAHGGMNQGGMRHGGMAGMSGMSHGGDRGDKNHGGGMMKEMMCGFTEHLDARLAYFKTELKITEQQTPQWNTFAEAWWAVAQKASGKCATTDDHQIDVKQGVPGKLSMMETHMADHLDIVRAQKAALEPLYNVLSDDQKKAANETLTRVMKVGMSMGGGGMGGMQHESDGGMGHGEMDHGGMGVGGMGMGGMRHGGMGQGGGMGGMQH